MNNEQEMTLNEEDKQEVREMIEAALTENVDVQLIQAVRQISEQLHAISWSLVISSTFLGVIAGVILAWGWTR